MISIRSFTMTLIAGLCVAATASAQSPAPTDSGRAAPASDAPVDSIKAGPRMETTATGIRRLATTDETEPFQRRQPQSVGRPMALMIVGGAAIVLGAVMGDDVGTLFMVGGTVTLLYGLYQYLQ